VIIISILAICLELGLFKKENPIETFINVVEPILDISHQFKDWDQTNIQFLDSKPIAWIYIPLEINSKTWLDFMSRRHEQNISPIEYTCLETIYKHLYHDFNIVFFNQKHIDGLLPNHKEHFAKAMDSYIYTILLKYSLLEKYGGIYIPSDTLFLKNIECLLKPYYLGYSITVLDNNLNYSDNKGVDTSILMAKPGHQIVKKCLEYTLSNLDKFQNAFSYREIMNALYNEILEVDNRAKHISIGLVKNSEGRYIKEGDLFSHNKLLFREDICFVPLRLDHIEKKLNYNYIRHLSREDLVNGSMEISRLFRSGLGISVNIDTELGDSNFYAYGKLGVIHS
jgi:hypothetical protein